MTTLFVGVIFLSTLFGQQKNGAILIDQFDPKVESPDVFEAKAKVFVKMLEEADKNTAGYITLYENDELVKQLYSLFGKDSKLGERINLLRPGHNYRGNWKNIEFWLVPEGSEAPFGPVCGLCTCPTIDVKGKSKVTPANESIIFTVSVSGGDKDITYKWTITGGEIVDGQGTPLISVKPRIGSDVEAKVEIGGTDPSCNCATEASFTTIYSYK